MSDSLPIGKSVFITVNSKYLTADWDRRRIVTTFNGQPPRGTASIWTITKAPAGYFIRNQGSRLFIGLGVSEIRNFTPVEQFPVTFPWGISEAGENLYKISIPGPGGLFVLEAGEDTSDVYVLLKGESSDQVWEIIPTGGDD